MRESKFRAFYDSIMRDVWRIEWRKGIIVAVSMSRSVDGFLHDEYWSELSKDDIKLTEYTGLKDKNGKEIFCDDLLAFDAMEWYGNSDNKDYIFQVKQSVTGEWYGAGTCSEWAEYCTVVGNIYQSPELLG